MSLCVPNPTHRNTPGKAELTRKDDRARVLERLLRQYGHPPPLSESSAAAGAAADAVTALAAGTGEQPLDVGRDGEAVTPVVAQPSVHGSANTGGRAKCVMANGSALAVTASPY